jgi:hypothetical protein
MHIERERERENERKKEREREREREKHHSLLSMTCIPHLHRSLAPRDPNQLLPLGLADGLHFCGTRIPPTRGVAPLSPHSAGRIGGTTAPSSQTHCPPQSTPKQSPPKQRQSHRGSGHHGSVLADALPEFAAQAACKPQAAGKPQATSSASNVISHPFPVTGLLPRTSLQTPAPRDSNHCGVVAHPGRRPGFTAPGECFGTALSATECRTQAQ